MPTAPVAPTAVKVNLSGILREAVETTASADPKDVAKTALALIEDLGDPDWHDLTRQLLEAYCPHFIARTRPSRTTSVKRKATARSGAPVKKTAKKTASGAGGSRLAALTRRIDSFLDSREYIQSRSTWIRLGDANLDDLAALRDDRYARAEQMTERGDWFGVCIDTCVEHEVENLRQLRAASETAVLGLMGVTIEESEESEDAKDAKDGDEE